jgi:transcriptional regulator with GAF, ATPase, and Fis domain
LKLSAADEKKLIAKALADNLWIQKDAARQLDISPRALNYRIKKLGITHARWRKNK